MKRSIKFKKFNRTLTRNLTACTQYGFGLLEVLISLLIIMGTYSITINLIADSAKKLRQLNQLNQVSEFMNIMKSNMEININNWQSYIGTKEIKQSDSKKEASDCDKFSCDENELENFHWANWQKQLNAIQIHDWSISIEKKPVFLSYNSSTVEITIRWDADGSGSEGTNCPALSKDDLDCLKFPLISRKPWPVFDAS